MSEEAAVYNAPPKGNKKKIVARILILAAVAVAGWFGYQHYLYVGTDDAYVQAHSMILAPRVGGTVLKVNVLENDKVKAGQVLALLDDRDHKNAYDQAMAEQAAARADHEHAEKDHLRVQKLYKAGAATREQYEAAEAKFLNLTARLEADRVKVEQATLNLSYTQIAAPEDGVIAKKSVEPGMVVPPGQALFGFVASSDRWVTANFKETQLARIKVGEKVDVTVDAIGGKTFAGVVDSIGSSTGSTFTLLPPDNSTGNFTKVVQRVPVKIRLVNLTAQDIDRLAAGLSAVVSVRVR